jgi:hypothetical protein
MSPGVDGSGRKLRTLQRSGGVEAGTPGMGAHPVTRYRVETAHRTEVTEIRPYCGRRGHFFCDANGPGRREAARRGHSLLLVLRRC